MARDRSQEEYDFLAELESENKLESSTEESFELVSFTEYVFSSKSAWYWLTILLGATAAFAVLFIPEGALSLDYVRSAFGLFFIMFLPGFVLTKSLFPSGVPIKTSSERMDKLERVVLSFGVSLILTPMVALILNYTPLGVRLLPITLSLLVFTVVLATVGIFRESKIQFGMSKT